MDSKGGQPCFRCACRKSGSDYPNFEKILESKDVGLHIYSYLSKVDARKTTGTNTSTTVFILHNATDDEISTQDVQKSLAHAYACPRCIHIYNRAQSLIKNIKTIDKQQTTAICDHCVKKVQAHLTRCKCNETMKKFLAYSTKESDGGQQEIKLWLKKIQHYMNDSNTHGREDETHSDSHLGKAFRDLGLEDSQCKIIHTKSEDPKLSSSPSDYGGTILATRRHAPDTVGRDSRTSAMGRVPIKLKKSKASTPRKEIPYLKPRKVSSDYSFGKTPKNANEVTDEKTFRYSFPMEKMKNTPIIIQVTSSDLIRDIKDRDEEAKTKLEEERKKELENKYLEKENKRIVREKAASKVKSFLELASYYNTDTKGEGADNKEQNIINEKKSNIQRIAFDHKELKKDETPVSVLDRKEKKETEKEMKDVEKSNIKKTSPIKDVMNVKAKTETDPKKKPRTEKEIKKGEKSNIKKVLLSKDVTNVEAKTEMKKTPKTEKEMKSNKENASPNAEVTDVKTKAEKAAEMLKQLLANDKKTVAGKAKKQSEPKLDSESKKLKSQTSVSKNDFAIANLIEMRKKEALSNKENKNQVPSKKKASSITCDKLGEDQQGEQMSSNPDLDLEVESSIVLEDVQFHEVPHIVIGEKILKYKSTIFKNYKKNEDSVSEHFERDTYSGFNDSRRTKTETSRSEPKSRSERKGMLKFTLSDKKYIDRGWTMLPTEKVVRKMYVYRMRPSHPEFDWFKNNKEKGQMLYGSGERLAEFRDDGRGSLFYKSGKLALDYYNAEESNVQQRYVVYSTGKPDEAGRPRPRTVLATFDYIGNGVVFDHTGKIRLKYNQTEGVVLDRSIGPASHWKWHTLNDPPELHQVMIDTHAPHKDPRILQIKQDQGDVNHKIHTANDAMLAIEFGNFIREKSKKISQTFKPFQIRMKAFKINENFSLRILDQATVYLIFRDGSDNVKLNIGMTLDHTEIVDTFTTEVDDCSVSIEKLPAISESVAALQSVVARAQRQDRARVRRELRLRPAAPTASADRLRVAVSRPLRPPLLTHSCTIATSGECRCAF